MRELDLLSVVAPVYNEEALIDEFYARVCAALAGLPFELVLVDDGSSDGTTAALERLADHDPRVRVVFLSRNFGHQTALTAGLSLTNSANVSPDWAAHKLVRPRGSRR